MTKHQMPEMMKAEFPTEGRAIYIPGSGFLMGWGKTLPTDPVFCKGAHFTKIDGAANQNFYINEAASGEGTTPSWVVVPTP